MGTGIGKRDISITITGYVTRDAIESDKIKYNRLRRFAFLHDEMRDTNCYLVERVRNAGDTGWDYDEYEDEDGNMQPYLQGKISGLRKSKKSYGITEYTFQFTEINY